MLSSTAFYVVEAELLSAGVQERGGTDLKEYSNMGLRDASASKKRVFYGQADHKG